jgi:hypothetical protein
MHQEHHYPHDEQDVNETRGNVKRQETKQPEDDQNRSDYCQHVFISLTVAHSTNALFLVGFVLMGRRLPD